MNTRRAAIWGVICGLLIITIGIFFFTFAKGASFNKKGATPLESSRTSQKDVGIASSFAGACAAACSLVVEPRDGVAPVLAFIRKARRSLDLVIYELEDPSLIAALDSAHARGVMVRVLLNHNNQNENAYHALSADGIPVRWAPPYFTFTHEKTMVADDARALIMTFNLVPKYYPTGRDFAIADTNTTDAVAIASVFESDWQQRHITSLPSGNDLVWSPGSRRALVQLIASATNSLEIYNEEMVDERVVSALLAAAHRGVRVEVVMTDSPEWHSAFTKLVSAGVGVRIFPTSTSGLYIHAKAIIADGMRAFLGSENFSATSLDHNRELGIMVVRSSLIAALSSVFLQDFAAARRFR